LYVFIYGRKGGDKTQLNAIALVNQITEIFTETETENEMKKHKSTYTLAIIVCLKICLQIPQGHSNAVNRRRKNNTMAKGTRTNNDLQNTTPNIKDRATRTTLKLGMNSGASGGFTGRAPLVTPIVLPLNDRYWLVINTSYLTTVL